MKKAFTHTRPTPCAKAGILTIVLILAALACDLTVTPSVTPTVTPSPTPTGVPPGWICHQNTTYGFEVCYPPDAALTTTSAEHSRLDLSIVMGTNLVEKWMDVDSRIGYTTCETPQAQGYNPASITASLQTIGGLQFLVQSAGEGAAGSYYDWVGYSTEKDGVCVSLTGVLHSTNPLMHSTPPPEFDRTAESAVFDQIVATFRWLAPTPTVPPGWLCYQNTMYAFEVCYPPDATLSDETTDHVRINLTFTPGTNLQEKWMDVDGRNTPPACESPQAVGYGPGAVTTETRMIAGLLFLVQSAGEGAAGSYYDWIGYSTEKAGVCASLTGVLHSTNPLMYSSPPPEFDMAAESAVFEQIANTFRWLSTAAASSSSESKANAKFKENANCRRGAGTDYDVVTHFKEGMVAPIVGRNEDSNWWLVQVPGTDIRCWVWWELVETEGDLNKVPFEESPVLGCWHRSPNDEAPKCVAPCPEGANPGGVCEP